MKKRTVLSLVLVTLLVACLPLVAGAASNVNVNVNVNVEDTGMPYRVDWENKVIQAVGYGAPNPNVTAQQARLLARRAAIVDAQRNLLESVKGVQIDAKTTMVDFLANDRVTSEVNGIVQGARIIREKRLEDGSYQVVMEMKLMGDGSVAQAALSVAAPAQGQPVPPRSAGYNPPTTLSSDYTGFVVDATGLDVNPTFSPVIYDETGRIIYGNMYIDYNTNNGMADYAYTPGGKELITMGQSRAGVKPMTVKAIALRDNNTNLVISRGDGDNILFANTRGNFIPKRAVVVMF